MIPRRAIFVGGPLHNQSNTVVNAPTHEDRRRVVVELEKLTQYVNQCYIKHGTETTNLPPI